MWKTRVILVCLLLAGVQALYGPSHRVKLCGREYVRTWIFTCGGPRWDNKRLYPRRPKRVEGGEVARSLISLEVLRYLDRKERPPLSTICCKWGCNKWDLSLFCFLKS